MNDSKQFIRHELLNICTILSLVCEENDHFSGSKEKIQPLIEAAVVLIEHEEILLGEKPEYFPQKQCLREIIDILLVGLEDTIISHYIQLTVDIDPTVEVTVDRHYFETALRYILQKLFQKSSFVRISVKEPCKLIVQHDFSPKKELMPKNISQSLQKENLYNGELAYQIGLYLFGAEEKKVTFVQKFIEVEL